VLGSDGEVVVEERDDARRRGADAEYDEVATREEGLVVLRRFIAWARLGRRDLLRECEGGEQHEGK
jgi:hypothetical protein